MYWQTGILPKFKIDDKLEFVILYLVLKAQQDLKRQYYVYSDFNLWNIKLKYFDGEKNVSSFSIS